MGFKEHRENPARAIFLNDRIDRDLFKKLAPEIIRLRLESSDPITLYIDSFGGSTYYAESILDLIKSPTQDNQRCKITSVCYGIAASAAADLLALGDYSIAYPQTLIYCHGTRESKEDITLEDVHSLADSLRETNENFAMRLASRVFKRMVYHIIMLNAGKEGERYMPFYNTATDPKAFVIKLKEKVTESKKEIFDTASERQKKISDLVNEVKQHTAVTSNQDLDAQANLLKAIIDFEAKRLKKTSKNFTRNDLNVIQEDFIQLNDFFYGRYRRNLEEVVCTEGHLFLTSSEEEELNQIKNDNTSERQKFLLAKVAPRLDPLWYFVVSICRELQHGDHPIIPTDAFWLGLVDEVIGSDLLSFREIQEGFERAKHESEQKAKA